ncbi:3-isopropylmalate dehydratase small subunit [Burkholderia sp. Ed8]|uniref:3-isopropylmalate dehydratase small subunit n=1 Tax=Burkholderia TaxID=32008 RepID=UPI00345C71E8
MEPFTSHEGIVVPIDRNNVDTDAIMPKQFMKAIGRTGFGPYVFDEWRFKDAGFYGKPADERVPNPDFVLNWPRYEGASILLSGQNFGCGSSREHAPWALQQAGVRVLIARGFADIFRNNCTKNGLLTVVLPSELMDGLFEALEATPGFRLCVDLESQTVLECDGKQHRFEIDATQKARLLEGADDVCATLKHADDIVAFETAYLAQRPWV